jgi:hypothetical protein
MFLSHPIFTPGFQISKFLPPFPVISPEIPLLSFTPSGLWYRGIFPRIFKISAVWCGYRNVQRLFYSILPKLKTNKVFEDLIGFAPGQVSAHLSWRLLFGFDHRIGEKRLDSKSHARNNSSRKLGRSFV